MIISSEIGGERNNRTVRQGSLAGRQNFPLACEVNLSQCCRQGTQVILWPTCMLDSERVAFGCLPPRVFRHLRRSYAACRLRRNNDSVSPGGAFDPRRKLNLAGRVG